MSLKDHGKGKRQTYSLRDLWASLPQEKNRADSYWTRWVLRPLSYPVSWVFLRLGWSANGVSYASAILAAVGGGLLSLPNRSLQILGAILLNLFAVLDCADGNIARVTRTTGPWGAWADAMGGYVAYIAALLGAGMATETIYPRLPPIFLGFPASVWPWGGWVLLGGIASASNLLMRLSYHQYCALQAGQRIEETEKLPSAAEPGQNMEQGGSAESRSSEISVEKCSSAESSPSEISTEKWISENLGITGLLMPALLLGVVTRTIGWVVIFYTVLYGGGAVLSLLRFARKVEKWKSSPQG